MDLILDIGVAGIDTAMVRECVRLVLRPNPFFSAAVGLRDLREKLIASAFIGG
jgi:hypothetical protein